MPAQAQPIPQRASLRGLLLRARTRLAHSQTAQVASLVLTRFTGIVPTPGIAVRHGSDLTPNDHVWIQSVIEATRRESALLEQSSKSIRAAIEEGRVFVAFDRLTGAFVGCLFPWHLVDHRVSWTEIGTIFVDEDARYGKTRLRICERMLSAAVREFEARGDMVLMTTTENKVVDHGRRRGMVVVPFESLPPVVHAATCCCPTAKTGAPSTEQNTTHCTRRDTVCFCVVSAATAHALLEQPN